MQGNDIFCDAPVTAPSGRDFREGIVAAKRILSGFERSEGVGKLAGESAPPHDGGAYRDAMPRFGPGRAPQRIAPRHAYQSGA